MPVPFRTAAAATLALASGLAWSAPTLVITRVAQDGDAAADDPGAVLNDVSGGPSIENGTIVIEGDTTGGVDDTELIFVEPGGPVRTFVRRGQVAPNGIVYGGSSNELLVDGLVMWENSDFVNGDSIVQLPLGADPTAVSPTVVAQVGVTEIPGQPGVFFDELGEFGFDDGLTIFQGENSSSQEGLYGFSVGGYGVIMDTSTPSPFDSGGGTIDRLSEPFIRDMQLSFNAIDTSGARGLLAIFDGDLDLRVIAESGDPLPGGVGVFSGFDESSIDGDYMAFQGGADLGGSGSFNLYLYQRSTDTITTIADDTVTIPGEAFTFTGFEGNPSIAGAHVLFEVGDLGDNGNGIYLYSITDQAITTVVREGQTFDGRPVDFVDSREASAGSENQFGFQVQFDDGDEAVYVLTVIDACFADCDGNGTLNVDDIDCFVAGFLGGDFSEADCDGNVVLNVDDIDCFVTSFLGGCP